MVHPLEIDQWDLISRLHPKTVEITVHLENVMILCLLVELTLVSMGPGAIQLNLIPYFPHSEAKDLILSKRVTNCLTVQWIHAPSKNTQDRHTSFICT